MAHFLPAVLDMNCFSSIRAGQVKHSALLFIDRDHPKFIWCYKLFEIKTEKNTKFILLFMYSAKC